MEYAQETLNLGIGFHNTSEDMLHAVNQHRRKLGKGMIKPEGLKRRADAFTSYKESGYLPDSSSEGENFDDTIDHIIKMQPHNMNNEQKAIYAENYNVEVQQVKQYWDLMHEKRVKYAQNYVDTVRFDDSPSEVLDKVNTVKIRKLTTLYGLDEKANKFAESGERNYHSSDDDRVREQALQQSVSFRRGDLLHPRNSTTWKNAEEEYKRRRGL